MTSDVLSVLDRSRPPAVTATGGRIQRRNAPGLTVGAVDDPEEHEADRIAATAMSRIRSRGHVPPSDAPDRRPINTPVARPQASTDAPAQRVWRAEQPAGVIRRMIGPLGAKGKGVKQKSTTEGFTIVTVTDAPAGNSYKLKSGRLGGPPPVDVAHDDDDYDLDPTLDMKSPAIRRLPAAVFHAVTPGRVNQGAEAAAKLGINDAAIASETFRKQAEASGQKVERFDHADINCALVTIAAIIGKRASEASEAVQATLGERPPERINTAIQSHNLWAMQLLPADVEPLVGLKLIEKINDPRFPEGNAYVIGDAQFNGMLRFLAETMGATAETVPGGPGPGAVPTTDTWHLYQHGEPGNAMEPRDAMVAAMKRYPERTRFACFVFDPAFGGGTGGHWVYAEHTAGAVAFVDFQKNAAKAGNPGKASETLDQLPYLDAGAPAKGHFANGMFIALAPPGTGAGLTLDPAVDSGAVNRALADAQLRLQTLTDTRRIADAATALPGAMFAEDPTEVKIPSPALVDVAVKQVVNGLCGLTGASSLGADASTWNILIAGHPRIDAGKVTTPNLASRTKLVGGAATDVLPAFTKQREGDALEGAIDKQQNLSAEAKGDYMWINAGRFDFTDLIHEVIHTYEGKGKSFSVLMAEGLADIYAAQVGTRLVANTGDPSFQYQYNSYYNPYRLRMENLIGLLGADRMARHYFAGGEDSVVSMQNAIKGKYPSLDAPQLAMIAGLLLSNKAADVDAGLKALVDGDASGASVLTHDEAALNQAKADADEALKSTGGESGLAKLYPFLGSAKGEEYLALSKTIGKMERDVAANTGETSAAVRDRLGKPVAVTFQVVLNTDTDSPIRVTGRAGEVGGGDERRAVPTRKTKPNMFVSAPIEFVAQRGKTVDVFVLNGMTKQAFTYRLTLPDRAAATAKLHNRGQVTLT